MKDTLLLWLNFAEISWAASLKVLLFLVNFSFSLHNDTQNMGNPKRGAVWIPAGLAQRTLNLLCDSKFR